MDKFSWTYTQSIYNVTRKIYLMFKKSCQFLYMQVAYKAKDKTKDIQILHIKYTSYILSLKLYLIIKLNNFSHEQKYTT